MERDGGRPSPENLLKSSRMSANEMSQVLMEAGCRFMVDDEVAGTIEWDLGAAYIERLFVRLEQEQADWQAVGSAMPDAENGPRVLTGNILWVEKQRLQRERGVHPSTYDPTARSPIDEACTRVVRYMGEAFAGRSAGGP